MARGILGKLFIESLHLPYQLVIKQELYSGGCEVKPRVVGVLIVGVVLVGWTLPRVQVVGAEPLDPVSQDFIKQACSTIYNQKEVACGSFDSLNENHLFILPSFEYGDHTLRLDRVNEYLTIIQSDVGDVLLDIAALDLQGTLCLPVFTELNVVLLRDLTSHIIPDFELKLLADSHHLLLVSFQLLYIHDQTAMLIHVFDALVVLEVPDLYVALAQRHQDVGSGNSVD